MINLAIDAVGLFYLLKCDSKYKRVVGKVLDQWRGKASPCYLEEKGVQRYLGHVLHVLNLNIRAVPKCPYAKGECCCVAYKEHESYGALCRCKSGDVAVVAKACCSCGSQKFTQGVVCEVGTDYGCLLVVKCDDLKADCGGARRGCGVSGG